MTDDLIKRLRDACDDTGEKRCTHDVGHYWNLCEEAADALAAASENEKRLLAQDVIHWKTRNSLLRERDAERLKRQQAEHERDSILEDLADAEKDAKRYRWLRNGGDHYLSCVNADVGCVHGNALDKIIDSASGS